MRYLRGLRVIWWGRGTDDILSFFFLWPVTVPLILLVSVCLTVRFSYLYVRRDSRVHSYYADLVDGIGWWKCNLHDTHFRGSCPEELVWR